MQYRLTDVHVTEPHAKNKNKTLWFNKAMIFLQINWWQYDVLEITELLKIIFNDQKCISTMLPALKVVKCSTVKIC